MEFSFCTRVGPGSLHVEAWKGGNIQNHCQGMSILFLVQFSSFAKTCVSLSTTPTVTCTHIDTEKGNFPGTLTGLVLRPLWPLPKRHDRAHVKGRRGAADVVQPGRVEGPDIPFSMQPKGWESHQAPWIPSHITLHFRISCRM